MLAPVVARRDRSLRGPEIVQIVHQSMGQGQPRKGHLVLLEKEHQTNPLSLVQVGTVMGLVQAGQRVRPWQEQERNRTAHLQQGRVL